MDDESEPQRYAAALIPQEDDSPSFVQPPTSAVVLEWHEPDLSGPPGRARTGFFEVMASANGLESAIKLASALNETNA